ncbi:MAG: TIM barrel protein [Spirochaetes bacterium]|nr:TIM barrel protein [Spirochaetota bacterium]
MFHYSPCLDIFFPELPFPERIKKVAALGYEYFEFWSWWNKDIAAVEKAMKESDMQAVGFCTKMISLVDASKRAEYLAGLKETIDVAKRLGTRGIISQVGNELAGVSRDEQKRSLIDGLKAAAPLLEAAGMTLLVEPLNIRYDHKGYFLSCSDEAAEIITAAGSKSVKMLFDIYHQQITEGDLINNIKKYLPLIGHFHIADHPGRHELGTGEINYQNVLSMIQKSDYNGAVGIELFPIDKQGHEKALKVSSLKV